MNNRIPSKETIARLREQYSEGTRVELISMDDPYNTKLHPGDKGSVSRIDDTGTIFVDWDNGSRLGIVYGVDRVRKIENEIEFKTGADFWRDTVNHYGQEEAAGICGRYLSMQIKTESREEKQFCKELFAAMYEDTAGHADPGKIVYPYSLEEANKRLEASLYHENYSRNAYCAQAIDTEINASCYETYHYNLDLAAMSVIQEYGFARVNAVLANTIKSHEYDGRYSQANKTWALQLGFSQPEKAFSGASLNAHPVLIDGFTSHIRAMYVELGAERFALPGVPEAGHVVENYEITRSITFDDQRGFAIGHNPGAPAPYVCWQFTVENGKREFYWGHYGGEKAAEDNYLTRIAVHMSGGTVREVSNPLAAAEISAEQNYNIIDGTFNNEKSRLDLTDGQTHEEIRELAPETLSDGKPSVLEQIREARKAPPTPRKDKSPDIHKGDTEL